MDARALVESPCGTIWIDGLELRYGDCRHRGSGQQDNEGSRPILPKHLTPILARSDASIHLGRA
jgi:hypothetical protein